MPPRTLPTAEDQAARFARQREADRTATAEDYVELIADLLPPNGKRGGQWYDHRATLNGILWVLHTGSQWRGLPERYGNWKSVHDRLKWTPRPHGERLSIAVTQPEPVEAGRAGYEAGLMGPRDFASPSTPVVGTPFWHAVS